MWRSTRAAPPPLFAAGPTTPSPRETRPRYGTRPGFAHGFYVESESADVLYKCTEYYEPALDQTIHWGDPDLAIDWPLTSGCPPLVSTKDAAAPMLRDAPTYS